MNKLLSKLRSYKSSDTVYNQYQNPVLINNLRLYLAHCKKKRIKTLLIGEAPGYAGCAITGIPFTSNRILSRTDISFFDDIRKDLLPTDNSTERSATIVWNALNDLEFVPVFWNSFPFHPHKKNSLKSNRAPLPEEVMEGKEYLKLVMEYLDPNVVAGLGWEGYNTLKDLFPEREIKYIRHPSYGGKPEFIKGLKTIKNI
ncbi:MAG: uracil-DNA glycosylase [Bacteroidota bacterium]